MLLENVYNYILEKNKLERTRKTWTLRHQEAQIEAAKIKRSLWLPEQFSVKSKLDALFEREGIAKMDAFSDEHRENHLTQLPVTMQVAHSMLLVRYQSKLVNKCLLHLMHREVEIIKHLSYLRAVYFGCRGDVVS